MSHTNADTKESNDAWIWNEQLSNFCVRCSICPSHFLYKVMYRKRKTFMHDCSQIFTANTAVGCWCCSHDWNLWQRNATIIVDTGRTDGPGRSEKLVNASISPLFIVRPSLPVNDCADDLIFLGCKYFSIMASALSSKAPSHVYCCRFGIWLILNNDTSGLK